MSIIDFDSKKIKGILMLVIDAFKLTKDNIGPCLEAMAPQVPFEASFAGQSMLMFVPPFKPYMGDLEAKYGFVVPESEKYIPKSARRKEESIGVPKQATSDKSRKEESIGGAKHESTESMLDGIDYFEVSA